MQCFCSNLVVGCEQKTNVEYMWHYSHRSVLTKFDQWLHSYYHIALIIVSNFTSFWLIHWDRSGGWLIFLVINVTQTPCAVGIFFCVLLVCFEIFRLIVWLIFLSMAFLSMPHLWHKQHQITPNTQPHMGWDSSQRIPAQYPKGACMTCTPLGSTRLWQR